MPELKTFQDFYRETISKNDVYLGAFLNEVAAREREEGTVGLYIPALTSNYILSNSSSPSADTETRAIDFGLSGKVPQLGLTYSTLAYSDTETIKPRPVMHQGQYNFSLSLSLLKDFGPRVGWIPFRQAEITYDLSKLTKLQTVYSTFNSLLSAFSSASASQKNLKINLESEKRNTEEFRKSTAQYRAGKIPRLSLLSLEAQTQQIRNQVIGQERVLRESFKNLYTLSSIDPEIDVSPFEVELQPIAMPFFDEVVIEKLVQRELDFNHLKNPTYLSAKMNLEQSKFSVIQAENNVLPSLNLTYLVSGSKSQPDRSNFFPQETRGNYIALNLSMPIGFVTERHELAATRSEFRSVEIRFEQLKRSLTRDWKNLVVQYGLLKRQLEISRDLSRASKEKYEASLSTASLGPTYQQNVILFQNEWVNNQINVNQLEVEFIVTQFQILSFHSHSHIFTVFNKLK